MNIEPPRDSIRTRLTASGKYRIEYNPEICIGASSCAAISPETFEMNEENIAVLIDGEDDDETVLAGAQSCPVLAIKIIEVETGKQIFPPFEDN